MIDLLNDPMIRAELTAGFLLVAGLAVGLGVVAMVADFVRFLRKEGGR